MTRRRYLVVVQDLSGMPRAWGAATTPKAAREEAFRQADRYDRAHPDNKLNRELTVTHILPTADGRVR